MKKTGTGKMGTYQIDLFHFEDETPNFEEMGHTNSERYWYARDFMKWLGYENYNSFRAVINRAIAACTALNISVADNFIQIERDIDGQNCPDFKLKRFACYLIAMNGDPKKTQVAKAQIYFVCIAETFRHYLEESEKIERFLIREEVSDREKSLVGVAKKHGVSNYPLFQNAGYRGMYNMNLSKLKEYKGIPDLKRSLLDFMGKEELASDLFRITQTEAKIRKDKIQGQENLENTAEKVGGQVRKAMSEISGNLPEDLAITDDIRQVAKELKQTHKKLKKIDKS